MERTIICLGCGSETAAKFAMLAADKRWHVRAYARDPEAFKSRLRDPYLGELSCEPIRLENAEEVRDAIREGTDAVVYFSGDEEEERHVSKLELVTQVQPQGAGRPYKARRAPTPAWSSDPSFFNRPADRAVLPPRGLFAVPVPGRLPERGP